MILSLCGDCCEGPGEQPGMTILFEQREVINFIRKSVYKLDRISKFLAESQILFIIMNIYYLECKIDGIHSRQEKLIGSLLEELQMICDFVDVW